MVATLNKKPYSGQKYPRAALFPLKPILACFSENPLYTSAVSMLIFITTHY